MGQCVVSVVMPVHNSSNYVSLSIRSLLVQTYPYWELIVVDDVSSDNTPSIIRSFMEAEPRIRYIPLREHHGPGLARNVGIDLAVGKYIAFLDSDDIWLPKKLERQLAFMQENNLCFTFSSYYIMDKNGFVVGLYRTKESVSYSDILKIDYIGCSTAIYDVSVLGKRYMKPIHGDYVLWVEILREIGKSEGLLEPLAVYRAGVGVSASKLKQASWRWQFYRRELHMSTVDSLRCFIPYAFHGVLKYGGTKLRSLSLSTRLQCTVTVEDLLSSQNACFLPYENVE